jgi:hypothetical protein
MVRSLVTRKCVRGNVPFVTVFLGRAERVCRAPGWPTSKRVAASSSCHKEPGRVGVPTSSRDTSLQSSVRRATRTPRAGRPKEKPLHESGEAHNSRGDGGTGWRP